MLYYDGKNVQQLEQLPSGLKGCNNKTFAVKDRLNVYATTETCSANLNLDNGVRIWHDDGLVVDQRYRFGE